ncbi:MAG: hypothetical protein P8Z79_07935 [Sedimentisphaerales bacterium]
MTNKIVHPSMTNGSSTSAARPGFSLAEVLASLIIGAMVLVAILAVYHRAEHSASAAIRKLEQSQLPNEVLQYIAEDLDSLLSSNADLNVTIQNKLEPIASGKLIPAARLAVTRTITDATGKEQTFEEVIWQSSYSIESLADGLVLYRSHSGINLEDKVLQQNKYDWEREAFVPICSGVTFFNIGAVTDTDPAQKWDGAPPTGIIVTLSFAEPYKNADGTYDVPEEDKITRTIAIDRTRKITFDIAGAGGTQDQTEQKQTEDDTQSTAETKSGKDTNTKTTDKTPLGRGSTSSRTAKPTQKRE